MENDIVLINIEEGLNRVMNNAKLFSGLLGKFKTNTYLNDLETAMARGDMERARISAHTLKGLSANLSMTELYKQVVELETQLKAGVINTDQLNVVKEIHSQTLTEADNVIAKYA